ncbi:MAG: arylsulfatase A-like enzyme [Planctomycetota bacterium]|jgi:arylsulfatase A-like enzyme
MLNSSLDSLTLTALLIGAVSSCGGPADSDPRPDVLLVVVDTLRSDHLSCYGYPRPTSPEIDKLAQGGVLFEDVTCQWPWTLPSMVSMFHGRYVTAYRDKLEEEVPTLPEVFQAAGYHTVGVVANCLLDEEQGFDRGFDQFDCFSCLNAEGEDDPAARTILELQRLVLDGAKSALTLDEDGKRKPLFLFIHAYDPHDPYHRHARYDGLLPIAEAKSEAPIEFWQETMAEYQPERDPAEVAQAFQRMILGRGRYDQEIRHLDEHLALLIKGLEAMGLAKDAIGAILSDHGEGLWEHLRNEKAKGLRSIPPIRVFYQIHGGNGYQPVMATPFILWGRGVPVGQRFSAGVENVDLFPTLLELVDIAPPAGLDGRSLVPMMRGESTKWREYVYCYGSHSISIRHVESGYKLIIPSGRSIENKREIELFNLNSDPDERVNLADQEPVRLKEMIEQYSIWMKENPTSLSTSHSAHTEQNEADKARMKAKLESLGYTGLETGE